MKEYKSYQSIDYKSRVPCINCVCYAICRTKTYTNLLQQCKLVSDYVNQLNQIDHHYHHVLDIPMVPAKWIHEVLNPDVWSVFG